MSEFTMDRLRENLEALKMKHTPEILDDFDLSFQPSIDKRQIDELAAISLKEYHHESKGF